MTGPSSEPLSAALCYVLPDSCSSSAGSSKRARGHSADGSSAHSSLSLSREKMLREHSKSQAAHDPSGAETGRLGPYQVC